MPPKDNNGPQRCRRWVFTCFDGAALGPPPFKKDAESKIRFIIMQQEQCKTVDDTTGQRRIHWQGYVEFKDSVRRQHVMTALGKPCYCSPARGTANENIAYCSKDECHVEGSERIRWGTPAHDEDTGRTNSESKKQMDELVALIQSGAPESEVMTKFPKLYLIHQQKIGAFITAFKSNQLDHKRMVYVEVRYGDCGTGKTTSCYAPNDTCLKFSPPLTCWPSENIFVKRHSMGQWFNGYAAQEVLLLDDFYPHSHTDAEFLFEAFDPLRPRFQTKGGHVIGCWRHVVLTCNIPPHEWFKTQEGVYTVPFKKRQAVLDRITRVTHFEGASHRKDVENIPEPWVAPTSSSRSVGPSAAPSVSSSKRFRDADEVLPAEKLKSIDEYISAAPVMSDASSICDSYFGWDDESAESVIDPSTHPLCNRCSAMTLDQNNMCALCDL